MGTEAKILSFSIYKLILWLFRKYVPTGVVTKKTTAAETIAREGFFGKIPNANLLRFSIKMQDKGTEFPNQY